MEGVIIFAQKERRVIGVPVEMATRYQVKIRLNVLVRSILCALLMLLDISEVYKV